MITDHAELLKKLPSWFYKIGAQSWIDYEYPRHLFIETTAKCNLSCGFCPREEINDHMDWSIFKEIIEEATRYGKRSFSLHLFGEPLLWPKLLDGIRFIKSRNRNHVVLLTTNGTHLNKFAEGLIESKVDKILWTWRPEAKFRPETKEKLRKWGRFCVRFIKEITPEEAYKEWEDWPLKEHRGLHNYGSQIDLSKWNVPPVETRWACYHPFMSPAVAWNGNILLCCADPKQQEVLGKFPEMSVAEAWKSGKIRKIRESHLARRYEGICKNCDVWKSTPDLFYSWQYTGPSSSGNGSGTHSSSQPLK